jgi:2-amino-4-hydroxy-6-hydroxymethyldihydropteridine diphosphokinase
LQARPPLSVSAYIALGTNQPFEGLEGPALLRRAIEELDAAGLRVGALSSIWRTPAWPEGSDQPDFHNAVAEVIGAPPKPEDLYGVLRDIEIAFGRERRERWGRRTLDLDILAMAQLVGDFDGVIIPHPLMQERAFVLAPLAEIASTWVHPVLRLSAADLLKRVDLSASTRRLD